MGTASAIAAAERRRRCGRASVAKVLSSAANGISEFIAANGADPTAVLGRVGIAEMAVMRDRDTLDLHRYCAMIEVAARETNNDNFGLHYGQGFTPQRLGLIGQIALASPTLGASLENLVRYFPYHQQNTEAAFRRSEGFWRLEYRILDGQILRRRQDAELTLGMYLNVVRHCLGCRWAPDEVHFEHPRPEGWQDHEAAFDAPVYFNMKTNALVFRDRDLDERMPGWSAGRMREYCAALTELMRGTGTLSLTDRVVGEIRSHLPSGYPHIEDIADALAMTRWTLQRRLADQGRVFSDLVEETRGRLATLYLGVPHLPIREIAEILGYSELSAFSRACVRWFDAPPSAMRARLLAGLSCPGVPGDCDEMSTPPRPGRASVWSGRPRVAAVAGETLA